MTSLGTELDDLCIKTIRMLAADAVQQANSGHPGLPLGAAPAAYVLWTRFLKHNPENPLWPDRDRFILSAGHGSALLYALLHLTGYDLSLEEVKNFRQWGSKTPGHPEYDPECGIEATTGPLGQGVGMGVGMALAERYLAATFNRTDFPVVDHYTYAIVSDGDLMEGIASEAGSLAGHLGLGKLIYLYDDNKISIEGSTSIAFTEDVEKRFDSFGWHTLRVEDGNDLNAIEAAITTARNEKDRPSLVLMRTHIGYGSPKQDSEKAHGEPLGEEALKATKEFFNWPQEPRFHIPDEALRHLRSAKDCGREMETSWKSLMEGYRRKFPVEGEKLDAALNRRLPDDWADEIPAFSPDDGPMATRKASGTVLNAIAKKLPTMLGGSADLAPSNNTLIGDSLDQSKENPAARNIRFGVREHAMAAVVNGMTLHRGVIAYSGTFLIFSDYMRPSLRLAALMDIPSIFIFTHDSIGLGEDGPTHQPIEHLASLRAMPHMTVLRPADANETAAAWRYAVQCPHPTALILTRQKMPILDPARYPVADGASRGAYVLSDCDGDPQMILIATGSEVSLALEAQKALKDNHRVQARVVSMPSWEVFLDQPEDYRASVLPPAVKKRLAIEAASPMGWCTWVGDEGAVIGIDGFGSSAPGSKVMAEYGFNTENVVSHALQLLKEG